MPNTRISMAPVRVADATDAGRAYDAVGDRYTRYADGDVSRPFDFTGRYGFADGQIWRALDEALVSLAMQGRRTVTILDVGCGPGTWLQRAVMRADELGFTRIRARGFDLSNAMVGRAAAMAADVTRMMPPGRACISIEHGDATAPLSEATGTVDLCLCLYGVLNHLPTETLPFVASELGRVTAGTLFVTVRAAGSLPTIYVDGLESARTFRQDNGSDRMEVDLADGRHLSFHSHLFRGSDLSRLFAPHVGDSTLRGLDLFHSRFGGDPRWNPEALSAEPRFLAQLARLEQFYADDPVFIDRAAHIMLSASCAKH
jgi:SAM-dependent methyltransferase